MFYSNNSYYWGDVTQNDYQLYGTFALHASEIIRDINEKWYISGAGWGEGGVYLEELTFNDNMDDQTTSMPPPIPINTPLNKTQFDTNLNFQNIQNIGFYSQNEYWVETPDFSSSLFVANPLNNTH